MLKRVSFIVAIFGIAILLVLLVLPAEEFGEIEGLEINEKVVLEGKVESERDFGDFKVWELSAISNGVEMDFEVVCECEESYLGKEIRVIGVVEEFNDRKQVRVLRIYTDN